MVGIKMSLFLMSSRLVWACAFGLFVSCCFSALVMSYLICGYLFFLSVVLCDALVFLLLLALRSVLSLAWYGCLTGLDRGIGLLWLTTVSLFLHFSFAVRVYLNDTITSVTPNFFLRKIRLCGGWIMPSDLLADDHFGLFGWEAFPSSRGYASRLRFL
ncbi:hypothetical protein F4861DRAFT_285500 [Xylaria intraflava]|nr:hypothetical protein F4861DRAFT_285500 [Xylaria intraflava]